jgi:hypothetical protein
VHFSKCRPLSGKRSLQGINAALLQGDGGLHLPQFEEKISAAMESEVSTASFGTSRGMQRVSITQHEQTRSGTEDMVAEDQKEKPRQKETGEGGTLIA